MDASLHVLRLRALLRVDDGRGDLSAAVWLDPAVWLHEHTGRPRNAGGIGAARGAGGTLPGRSRPRSGFDARVGAIAGRAFPLDAVPHEPHRRDPSRAA